MANDPDIQPVVDELHLRNRQIAAVHTISRLMSSTLDADERMEHILQVCMDAVDAAAGTFYIHRPADRQLVFQYVAGEKADALKGRPIGDDQGIVGSVFHSGEGTITNHARAVSTHDEEIGKSVGVIAESVITAPLKVRAGNPVGVIQLVNKRTGTFNHHDMEVVDIVASMAATAIQNARLSREAQLAAVATAVGDLSHDIKNKITPIAMAVDTLKPTIETMLNDLERIGNQSGDPERTQINNAMEYFKVDTFECFDIIMDQVREVQEYTKLIADTLKGNISEPLMEPHDLHTIVENTLARLDPISKRSGISIIRKLETVPTCKVDKFRIESAVFNLVNNAIPETLGGTITVSLKFVPAHAISHSGAIVIEVCDTGKGMPPNKLDDVLRGDARSSKPGGTGLGTRIVYKSVIDHKGQFEGESSENVGTTFRIILPFICA